MTPTVPAARLTRETQPPKPQGVGLDSAAVRARMVQRLAAAGIAAAPGGQARGAVARHGCVASALATPASGATRLRRGRYL